MSYPRIGHSTINGIEYKNCCRCGKWLPLANYWKDSKTWDSLVGWCKACVGKPVRAAYIVAREEEKYIKTKVCQSCRVEKPKSLFTKNRQCRDGLNRQCAECRAAYKREKRRQERRAATK